MIKVGITGGIGSGKTLVANIFEKLSVPVFYSDREAAYIMHNNQTAKQQLSQAFGTDLYEYGRLNRIKLRALIFNNDANLTKVNQIVHPLVKEQFLNFSDKHNDKKYIIQEAAILFESGAWELMDSIIMVTAPDNIRCQRVIQRDGIANAMVKKIMARQLPEKEKANRSDYLIDNSGEALVIEQVLELHKKLQRL